MARLARVVAVDIPHHVTQRGNGRRFILESDSEKLVYLDLRRQYCTLELLLLGYYLMSNHVHLVVTPTRQTGGKPGTDGAFSRFFGQQLHPDHLPSGWPRHGDSGCRPELDQLRLRRR
jgi:putative transposase